MIGTGPQLVAMGLAVIAWAPAPAEGLSPFEPGPYLWRWHPPAEVRHPVLQLEPQQPPQGPGPQGGPMPGPVLGY